MSHVGDRDGLVMPTTTYKLADGEKLLQCPYDKSHQILPKSFKTHLDKCRRNFPLADMSVCRFNAQHHVPTPELAYHEKCCYDSKALIHSAIQKGEVSYIRKFIPDATKGVDRVLRGCDENWDDDDVPAAYNPLQKIQVNPQFLCIPEGKTKSQRKQSMKETKIKVQKKTGEFFCPPNIGLPLKEEPEEPTPFTMFFDEQLPPLPRPKIIPIPEVACDKNKTGLGLGRGRIAANIFGKSIAQPDPDEWTQIGSVNGKSPRQ